MKNETGKVSRRAVGLGTESWKGMMEMASYSPPINRSGRKNILLYRKMKAAINRFIGDDDQTRAFRKAREADPEYPAAMMIIISDILRTKP